MKNSQFKNPLSINSPFWVGLLLSVILLAQIGSVFADTSTVCTQSSSDVSAMDMSMDMNDGEGDCCEVMDLADCLQECSSCIGHLVALNHFIAMNVSVPHQQTIKTLTLGYLPYLKQAPPLRPPLST
ncbi:MAG: hypothetical protein JKX87_04055 [Cycloclasticus sp.]|nr:hypothetical protein [Cycloclasticus sp.]